MSDEEKKLSHVSPIDEDPDFEEGGHQPDIYDAEGREEEVDSDEIDDVEAGFVEGYEQGEHEVKCAQCGKVLVDDDLVEEELDGEHYRFCNSDCALNFETGKKKKQEE